MFRQVLALPRCTQHVKHVPRWVSKLSPVCECSGPDYFLLPGPRGPCWQHWFRPCLLLRGAPVGVLGRPAALWLQCGRVLVGLCYTPKPIPRVPCHSGVMCCLDRDGLDPCAMTLCRSGCPPLRKPILEAGACVKESGLFADAGHLEDGDSCHIAHLHLSVEAEVFIRRERGREQRDQGRALRSPLRADEPSPL